MTAKDTIEGNKLIAEFMGAKYKKDSKINLGQKEIWIPVHGVFRYDTIDLGKGPILEYHKSWGWLMGVIEKIERAGFDTEIKGIKPSIEDKTIYRTHIYDLSGKMIISTRDLESRISVSYNAVIEFIKWYNLNK